MTIGIDISSLQGPHRMRGIGYTLINFVNNVSVDDHKKHKFIFYAYTENNLEEALNLLNLGGLDYELRPLTQPSRINKILPAKLNIVIRLLNLLISFKRIHAGDPRIQDTSSLDVFLQTDQNIALPKGKFKKALILYDIIPYVLEWDYMWTYKTARFHSLSRKAAMRCFIRRKTYAYKTRLNCKRADVLLSISECTKNDFIKYVGIKPKKIIVVPLGVNPKLDDKNNQKAPEHKYIKTSWGYTKRPNKITEETKYLLFVGGADSRRKIADLVTAFNHLRAEGYDIKLILAGDTMQGPDNIPTKEIHEALKNSSYLEDIIFLGFISDQERDWLYKNALAFVYPSKYEGFGLPVLEAMNYGTPVITYKNSSIPEVAGGAAMYASGYRDIVDLVEQLLNNSVLREKFSKLGKRQVKKFSWEKTGHEIIQTLVSK